MASLFVMNLVKRLPDPNKETHHPEQREKDVSIEDDLDEPGNYGDYIEELSMPEVMLKVFLLHAEENCQYRADYSKQEDQEYQLS